MLLTSSITDTLLKPSHDRQLLGATRILKVMSLELWYQTNAGLYVSVEMYGLLPVNRPGTTPSRCHRNNEKRVSFLFISGREAIFHSEEQIEQHFIHREENKWSQSWLFTVSLAGYVSAVPEAVCTFVRYVCLNLSLNDAIFISRETSHLTTGIKIKHFFGGENLFLWVYCHRLLKAALQLTCWEEYLCFFFWIAIYLLPFHPSISQITCCNICCWTQR